MCPDDRLEITGWRDLPEGMKAEVESLLQRCGEADGNVPAIKRDLRLFPHPQARTLFTAHRAGRLIGFASLFAVFRDAVEVQGVVDPEARRLGVFAALDHALQTEAARCGFREILYVVDRMSKNGQLWAHHQGLQRTHSEMTLRLLPVKKPLSEGSGIMLEPFGKDRGELLKSLHARIFDLPRSMGDAYLDRVLEDPYRTFYLGLDSSGAMVGIGAIHCNERVSTIFGFGVVPEKRGSGYGKRLLERLISAPATVDCLEMELEVDEANHSARRLYERAGFVPGYTVDYFRK